MNELDPEDLIALARRRRLSPNERQQLERALGASAALRVLDRVSQDFSRLETVRGGDDQLVERFVGATMKRRASARLRTRHWSRRAGWLAAAALLGSVSLAAAFWQVPGLRFWGPVDNTAPSGVRVVPSGASPVDSAASSEPESTTAEGSAIQEPAEPRSVDADSALSPLERSGVRELVGQQAASAEPGAGRSALAKDSPASLFAAAKRARAGGQTAQAVADFQKLQHLFPASAEATLSRISLGRLLLARGRSTDALAQFSGYLGKGRPLDEEALQGRARALAALGRFGEERAAWKELLARFPESVYAGEARQRARRGATSTGR